MYSLPSEFPLLSICFIVCCASPIHYHDLPELETSTVGSDGESFHIRQAESTVSVNMTSSTTTPSSVTVNTTATSSQSSTVSSPTSSPTSETTTPRPSGVNQTLSNTTLVTTTGTPPQSPASTLTAVPATNATAPSHATSPTTTTPTTPRPTGVNQTLSNTTLVTTTGTPPQSAVSTMTTVPATTATASSHATPPTTSTPTTTRPTGVNQTFSNTTLVTTTGRPPQSTASTLTTVTHATPPTTSIPTTTRPPGVNQSSTNNCTLGDDILHMLFNRTTTDSGMFTLENSVGIVGSREEVLAALMGHLQNYSREQIEACLDLYMIPHEPAVGTPDPSGSSHLIYHRPGQFGGLPSLPVQQPPSDNFVYGHGYTTYVRPFNVANRVPVYSPHRYLKANSLQDLFQVLMSDFSRDFNLLWEHGTPAFWFDRNAAPRNPPRG